MPRCGREAAVAVIAVSLLATLAACGDPDSNPASTQSTVASPTIPPTATPTTTTEPAPTTTTASPSTTLSSPPTTTQSFIRVADAGPPIGLIRFGEDGIVMTPFDGDQVVIPGDRYYPIVRQAEPDGIGGFVYQLMEPHPSWPEGTIFRLAPDATAPQPVFTPLQNTRTELYDVLVYEGEQALLLGHQITGGHDSTTVVIVPFSSGEAIELKRMTGLVDDVSYGGGMFVARTPFSDACATPAFFDVEGAPLDPPAAIGCNLLGTYNLHLAADGSVLVYQRQEDIGITSLTTGERWLMDGYLVDYDGQSTAVVIGPGDGERWLVEVGSLGFGERTVIDDPGWARLYHHPIEVGVGATLDLGTPDVECSTADSEFVPASQALPAAVTATRDAIAAAATSCDFPALAALAEPHDSFEFYTSCCSFRGGMEGDPERYWLIGESSNTDELLQLVRLLQMEAGRIDGGWVWPAAVVQNESEIDWAALERLLGGQYQLLYEVSRDRGYYNGYVVEIMDDGRWRMFKQVIDPPIAG